MKTFHKQFCECSEENLIGEGDLLKFKDHPELLPHPIMSHKAAVKVAEMLKKYDGAGLLSCICLRFNNGYCRSANKKCQELRRKEK